MATNTIDVYVGIYESPADADYDYDTVKDLHKEGVIGTYDAATIEKDDEGDVKVRRHEKPTEHGAWTGLVAGGVVGILFPPSILGTALVGGATGGLIGHLWRGMSRKDLKELGEEMDKGTAALVVVAQDELDHYADKLFKNANKAIDKQIQVDAKNLQKEVNAAFSEAKK